jgi:hypothetical protein
MQGRMQNPITRHAKLVLVLAARHVAFSGDSLNGVFVPMPGGIYTSGHRPSCYSTAFVARPQFEWCNDVVAEFSSLSRQMQCE